MMLRVLELLKYRLKGHITPDEAYNFLCEYYDEKLPVTFLYEYKNVYGIRKRPSEMICVQKKTGKVMWEEDLPDDLFPNDWGKMRLIKKR